MFLVIKGKESQVNIHNTSNYIIFEDFCDVKNYLSDYYIVLLIDTVISEEGIVDEYNFFFEEMLITLNVKCIISNSTNEKLTEIASFYNIPYISL